MGHGKEKSIKLKKKKVWKILDGTYKPRKQPISKEDVERLVAAVQQECYWDDRDVETWDEQGTPLGAIMAANPNTKPPKDNSGKTKKPKRGSKKQFLNEWEKEAGSIRKQNE